MNVLLNGQPVDIGIEHEKTLKELADSIQNWSAERNLIFTGLYCEQEYQPAGEIKDTPLDTLETVDFQIESKSDLVIGSITEAAAFCEKLLSFIDELVDDPAVFAPAAQDVADSLEWLSAVSASVVSLLELDAKSVIFLDRSVNDYLSDLSVHAASANKLTAETLIGVRPFFEKLRSLYKMLLFSDAIKNLVISSIDSPDQLVTSLMETRKTLAQQVDNLEKVAALFQSGKDNEAVEMFYPFLDFMYAYLRLSAQTQPVFGIDISEIVIDDVSLEEKNSDIHGFLSEIVEVMENDDIISMADILEYEMKPLLAQLPDYLDELINKVNL